MNGGVWQALWQTRRTAYENTVLNATSALLVSFVREMVKRKPLGWKCEWFVMWTRSRWHQVATARELLKFLIVRVLHRAKQDFLYSLIYSFIKAKTGVATIMLLSWSAEAINARFCLISQKMGPMTSWVWVPGPKGLRHRWKTWHWYNLKCHREVLTIWLLWSADNGAFTCFYLLLRLYIKQGALLNVI